MKKTLFYVIGTVIFVLFMSMGGCNLLESRYARLTTDFEVLTSDSRILYESGAEALAEKAALYLPDALKAVESKQYGQFTEPISIYAFASTESFSKFSGISEKARGASVGSEIYLSGMLLNLHEEVYGMIGHELSHVQLSQALGTITFNRTLPRWFREGLAIYVSDGGGAPRNFEKETIEKFVDGKHFLPVSKGSLFNRNLKVTGSIGPRMFYSQSGMFVRYIAKNKPLLFEKFIIDLQTGKSFKESFIEIFNSDVDDALSSYLERLTKAHKQSLNAATGNSPAAG
jgi:hypothetical protein